MSRFFVDSDGWWALGWDGSAACWDRLSVQKNVGRLFDRKNEDGPWAVTDDNCILNPRGQTFLQGQKEAVVACEIARDGNRVITRSQNAPWTFHFFDLTARKVSIAPRMNSAFLSPGGLQLRSRNLRKRFDAIAKGKHGRLMLRSHRGQWLEVAPPLNLEPSAHQPLLRG